MVLRCSLLTKRTPLVRRRIPSTWSLTRQSDNHSDSDDSSAAVVVEPIDQAAADVPCLADLMATPDFTQYLLNDPRAPMVTVSLEEQALAPARTLARVPYLEHFLALVQRGCAPADLPTAIAPALAQAHADLATYFATVSLSASLIRHVLNSSQKRLLTTAA